MPMAIFGALMVNESTMNNLALRTQSLSRAVEARLAIGSDIDEPMLERWVDDGDMPALIHVESPSGVVLEVGEPIEGNTAWRSQNTASGAVVEMHVPSSELFWRGA